LKNTDNHQTIQAFKRIKTKIFDNILQISIINIFLLINKHLDIHSVQLEAAMRDHVMVLLDVIPETLKLPLLLAKVQGYTGIPLP
jgi:hypothetical protein